MLNEQLTELEKQVEAALSCSVSEEREHLLDLALEEHARFALKVEAEGLSGLDLSFASNNKSGAASSSSVQEETGIQLKDFLEEVRSGTSTAKSSTQQISKACSVALVTLNAGIEK